MNAIWRPLLTFLFVTLSAVAPAAADTSPPPIYPGATLSDRPSGVGLSSPPPSAKTYVTRDDFAKVVAWYRARLGGVPEVAQPGMEKTEDAFLVGQGPSAMVVMVQNYDGKTYVIIGPPI